MTKQEAIQYIRNATWLAVWISDDDERDKIKEAVEIAVSALKKQTPMKPILLDDEDLICPVCDADVEWKRYCENCGQKIDWGES